MENFSTNSILRAALFSAARLARWQLTGWQDFEHPCPFTLANVCSMFLDTTKFKLQRQ